MDRHIHMGPRTGVTAVEKGWEKGHQFGVIASGDNHSVPGVYGFGTLLYWLRIIQKKVSGMPL